MAMTINGTTGLTFNDATSQSTAAGTTNTTYASFAGSSTTTVSGISSAAKVIHVSVTNINISSGDFLLTVNGGSGTYTSVGNRAGGTNAAGAVTSTSGFIGANQTSRPHHYMFVLTYMGNNAWSCNHSGGNTTYPGGCAGAGWVTGVGAISSITFANTAGSSFSTGNIGVLYF